MRVEIDAKVNRRLTTKYSAGPGGMHCHCCGAGVPPCRAKPKNNRTIRRCIKQAMRRLFVRQED